MADNQAKDSTGNARQADEKLEKAQVPPGSRTGTDKRQSAGGNASVSGPGGPDAGSDAMPGRSNAL